MPLAEHTSPHYATNQCTQPFATLDRLSNDGNALGLGLVPLNFPGITHIGTFSQIRQVRARVRLPGEVE